MDNINLLTIFTTGLLTGGLTCIAVQGGLLTAFLAQQESTLIAQHKTAKQLTPIIAFLIAKLIAYTLLGAALGWLGSLIHFSLQVQIILQLLVVIFMVGTALNLLQVHPIFRYFAIQPPRFLTRFIRRQTKNPHFAKASRGKEIMGSAFLGALTIFIPCGTTQAMMALAIGTGNPWWGATILFAFILGTSPVFFILGYLTVKLGEVLKQRFTKIAAVAILLLALFNLDNTVSLLGSPYTLKGMVRNTFCIISYCDDLSVQTARPVEEQTITINQDGYSPNTFAVRAGSQVKVHLVNKGSVGCTQAFTIPSLNLQKVVAPNSSGDLVFTAPDKPGNISFMCSMGMYEGTITVI